MIKPYSYCIALTGGIGSGKSSTCSILKLYGFEVIDCDKISHEVLDSLSQEVSLIFGKEYVEGNRVERKKLGKLIFSDGEKKEELEKLLHPKIREKVGIEALKLEQKKVPYFVDIPLFFETKNYNCAKSLLVYAPKELQIERIIKRDNLSEDEAIQRVNSQIDIEKKREMSDYIVDNSKDLKNLQNECERIQKRIKEDFCESNQV